MPENPLRQEVEAAVLEEVERVGPGAFRPDYVIPRFVDRGASKPTLYRWIATALRSGKPAAAATAKFKAKVDEIAAAAPEPEEAVMGEVLARVPRTVTMADTLADPGGVTAVIERTGRIMRNLEKLELHAQTAEGAVRNAKLFFQVTMGMNRAIETACRLREMLRDDEALERRTAAMVEEIRRESPECAKRIAARLFELDRSLRG